MTIFSTLWATWIALKKKKKSQSTKYKHKYKGDYCQDNGRKKVVGELTRARSLFKLRKTSCFLIDRQSAISSGRSKACSMASAT